MTKICNKGIGVLFVFAVMLVGYQVKNASAEFPPPPEVCVPLPLGLISWWPGDGDTSDIIGASNGTLQNGAMIGTGLVGQAFSFDGADDYVDLGTSDVFDFNSGSGDFTIEAWILPETMPGFASGIVAKATEVPFTGWAFYFYSDGTLGFGGVGIWEFTSSPGIITTNEWAHVAITKAGSTYCLYKDGSEVGSAEHGNLETSAASLKIGRDYPDGSPNLWSFNGLIDEVGVFNRVLSISEIQSIFNAHSAGKCKAPPNTPPTAAAGSDQSIRAGDTVLLDGSASFDDNTPSASLLYSWSFASLPAGSTATLSGADTATPTFVADVADTFVVQLVVSDEGGLTSTPDEVVVSSDNLTPAAAAGDDQLVIVGTNVFLDVSGSVDAEDDPLSYSWTITSAPAGSTPSLSGADTENPTLIPDLEGLYEVTLEVSDFIGPGTPDTVEITATTAANFAEIKILAAVEINAGLGPDQVTTKGNQRALINFLSEVVRAIQGDKLTTAIDKLQKTIARTNGCVNRGAPDGNGPERDWITDCVPQEEVYYLLIEALAALTI